VIQLIRSLVVVAVTGLSAIASEPVLVEVEALGKAFAAQNLTGAFAYRDPDSGEIQVWNKERALERFIPASTFKIANTVIGLDCGAVKDVDEVLPYGGKPQRLKQWEKDAPLREAIVISSVPVYQELARRIGKDRMAEGLKKLGYGNRQMGEVIDRFWLNGDLQISAAEQVVFLQKLVSGELPVSEESVAGLREIIQKKPLEGGGILCYKTGWSDSSDPQIGWLVGWVETEDKKVAPFAMNIDMAGQKDADKRLPLAVACLRELGKGVREKGGE
jgi:beta-lactamase class D